MQLALKTLKTAEDDIYQATLTEKEVERLKQDMNNIKENSARVEAEKEAVGETNKILIDELMEQLLTSTRRCDEIYKEAESLKTYVKEADAYHEELDHIRLNLKNAEESWNELQLEKATLEKELQELRDFKSNWTVGGKGIEEVVRLRDECSSLARANALYSSQLHEQGENMRTLKASHDSKCQEYVDLCHQLSNSNCKCEQLEERIVALEGNVKTCEYDIGLKMCQLEEIQSKLDASVRESLQKAITIDSLRNEKEDLGVKLLTIEEELNVACSEQLELLERENVLKEENTSLVVSKRNLEEELRFEISVLQKDLSECNVKLAGMVDKAESEMVFHDMKSSFEDRLLVLTEKANNEESRVNELLMAISESITKLKYFDEKVRAIISHPDIVHHGGVIYRTRHSSSSLDDDVPDLALSESILGLQSSIDILCELCGPINKAVGEVCLYMLRGRSRPRSNDRKRRGVDDLRRYNEDLVTGNDVEGLNNAESGKRNETFCKRKM